MAYLVSPVADFMTGAVIALDGARDNWVGAWPPAWGADEGGKPLAEERRS